ncbi:hypothetical protein [Sorangium sp. So ce1335]|uniref:hypothetical protein n=1 Tax=Sorangium sp. So ce1335 TaxID=3133335 RepID=UPI003F64556C
MAHWQTVDWSKLKRKDGSAQNLPHHLGALTAAQPEARAQARGELRRFLCDAADWFSASAPAITSLVDLAADPATPDRGQVLALAVDVLTVGHRWFLARGLDFREARVQSLFAKGTEARRALEAMEAELPRLARLAEDADAGVRAAAAMALAFIASAAAPSRALLLGRLDREPEPLVRGSVAVALGMLGRYEPSAEIAQRLRALVAGNEPEILRGVAFAARLHVDPAPPSAAELELAGALLRATRVDEALFPWMYGRVDHLVEQQLKAHSEEGALVAARLLLAMVRDADASDPLRNERAKDALGLVLDPYADAPDALSEGQAEVARELTRLDVDLPFALYHLPGRRRDRRRFLGIDPPGPLDRVVPLDLPGVDPAWPLWRTLRFLGGKRFDERVLAERLREALSPEDYLGVCGEWKLGTYGVRMRSDLLRPAIEAAPADVAQRWGRAFADMLLDDPSLSSNQRAVGNYAVLPLVRGLGPGQVLEDRYDGLLTYVGPEWLAREVLSALPLDRRERVLCDEIERNLAAGSALDISLRLLVPLLDLAPTERVRDATSRLVARVEPEDEDLAAEAREALAGLGSAQ